MFFDPFSPPPLPRNEHEARVVGVIFFALWGLGLLFLYWQSGRAVTYLKDGDTPSLKSGEESEHTTK